MMIIDDDDNNNYSVEPCYIKGSRDWQKYVQLNGVPL